MAQIHLIVGAGNMGGALLSGWLDASIVTPRSVAILDPNPGVEAVYAIERGARHLTDTEEVSRNTQIALLAIKPQMFPHMGRKLSKALPDGTMIMSIMAGVTTATLKTAFPNCSVVRAMPNTPAAIGKGITAYVADTDCNDTQIATLEALLGTSGKVIRVESDEQINAVTAISGSGPAYIFHLCEALAGAGQSLGLPHATATELARETVIGASALMDASDRSPTELREAVTSPGGTTQAALDVLMATDGMGNLMKSAVRAALNRAKELSG